MRTMVVACAGHWFASLLFLVPVAGVAGAMKLTTWRADREEAAAKASPSVAEAAEVPLA